MNWRSISRRLGKAAGTDRMLCAHAYARHWPGTIRAMDALALILWGERDHCRRCWQEETAEREMPDRVRAAGG
jgi:hypothetical protein